ncbi:MAG TPA: GNAT family N-acetyltransferase [Thermoplasmata archaeon]
MAPEQEPVRGGERSGPTAEKPSGVVLVERVTHQDVSAICALYRKVWDPAPSGVPVELVKAWQPTPLEFTSWMGGVTYFAARKDGRLVGVVGCELHHGSCRMVHLVVDPEVRRQGVATALVGAAIDWTKKGNVASIWVDSLHGLGPATALFQRLDFTLVGVLHQHEWGEDVNFFERLV